MNDLPDLQRKIIIETIGNFMLTQSKAICKNYEDLPSSAFSSWSLGYIYGTVDGFLEAAEVKTLDKYAGGAMEVAYAAALGREVSSNQFGIAIQLRDLKNPLFINARKRGKLDAINYINNKNSVLNSWTSFITYTAKNDLANITPYDTCPCTSGEKFSQCCGNI